MRYTLSIFALLLCFGGIVAIFWYQELQYSLPTPVPANYKAIPVGHVVQDVKLVSALPEGPLFLHFYNPDCPCSRFNANHLKSLIRMYQDSVQLFIVVPSAKAKKKAVNEFGKHLEYIVDDHQKIASAYGVYATPQAVLVDREENYFTGVITINRATVQLRHPIMLNWL